MNRFSYVSNRPVNFNDPTGHVPCDEDGVCGDNLINSAYSKLIKDKFKWNFKGSWTTDELKIIYTTGNDIIRYVDGLTGGKGQGWLHQYLGGITIAHDYSLPNNQAYPSGTPLPSVPPGGIIYLNGNWTDGTKKGGWEPHQLLAHEIGHHIDCASGGRVGLGCVGGGGDRLADYIGAEPGIVRFDLAGSLSFLSDPNIPLSYRWSQNVNQGYGNHSSGEYFAEAFSWNIYDKRKLPQSQVGSWLDVVISLQSAGLP